VSWWWPTGGFASSKSHWYGGVTEADVLTLVEQHLVGGEPVEMLHIGPDDILRLKSAHNLA
jgi:(2Fe-2S) ferredoxin